MQWNRVFIDLIRNSHAVYQGDWTLAPIIKPDVVGLVSPDTGNFMPVEPETPDVTVNIRIVPNQWKLSTNNVYHTEINVKLNGPATDPESGTRINAGMEVKWGLSSAGSIASKLGIALGSYINDLMRLIRSEMIKWLAEQAQSISMSLDDNTMQDFGVMISMILVNNGLNVDSQGNNASLSVAGSAGVAHDMPGSTTGKGPFVLIDQTKNVDRYL